MQYYSGLILANLLRLDPYCCIQCGFFFCPNFEDCHLWLMRFLSRFGQKVQGNRMGWWRLPRECELQNPSIL